MDPVLVLLLALLGFMIIGSLVAIETRGLLSSVICVGAVGFALSVIFLLLGAPDLAITQVVVEILVLVVLVRVVITRRDETYATSRSIVAVAFWALGSSGGEGLRMRPFGNPLLNESAPASAMAPAGEKAPPGAETVSRSIGGAYLERGLPRTHAANYVMGIVLDYRGYDTLGEATVILVAILGAFAVLRQVGRTRHARHEPDR
jgi:multisubunit Na+/H+ antiporter MnhB subunit